MQARRAIHYKELRWMFFSPRIALGDSHSSTFLDFFVHIFFAAGWLRVAVVCRFLRPYKAQSPHDVGQLSEPKPGEHMNDGADDPESRWSGGPMTRRGGVSGLGIEPPSLEPRAGAKLYTCLSKKRRDRRVSKLQSLKTRNHQKTELA